MFCWVEFLVLYCWYCRSIPSHQSLSYLIGRGEPRWRHSPPSWHPIEPRRKLPKKSHRSNPLSTTTKPKQKWVEFFCCYLKKILSSQFIFFPLKYLKCTQSVSLDVWKVTTSPGDPCWLYRRLGVIHVLGRYRLNGFGRAPPGEQRDWQNREAGNIWAR